MKVVYFKDCVDLIDEQEDYIDIYQYVDYSNTRPFYDFVCFAQGNGYRLDKMIRYDRKNNIEYTLIGNPHLDFEGYNSIRVEFEKDNNSYYRDIGLCRPYDDGGLFLYGDCDDVCYDYYYYKSTRDIDDNFKKKYEKSTGLSFNYFFGLKNIDFSQIISDFDEHDTELGFNKEITAYYLEKWLIYFEQRKNGGCREYDSYINECLQDESTELIKKFIDVARRIKVYGENGQVRQIAELSITDNCGYEVKYDSSGYGYFEPFGDYSMKIYDDLEEYDVQKIKNR